MKRLIVKLLGRSYQEIMKEYHYLFSKHRPRKILFNHIPKCAGSTLSRYLEKNYPYRKTFTLHVATPRVSVEQFRKFPEKKRHAYDLVKGHLAHDLLDYVHPESVKVTVLREPVDRIISHYYYAKRTPTHYLYPKIQQQNMTLVDYATANLSEELRNWYTVHFSGITLEEAERNPEASVLQASEVILNRYDIIGILDSFTAFENALRKHANLQHEYNNNT